MSLMGASDLLKDVEVKLPPVKGYILAIEMNLPIF
jgi:hypothetical protein